MPAPKSVLGLQVHDIEESDRLVVGFDLHAATFPAELAMHLRGGGASPGVFVIRRNATVATVLLWLELVVADDQPDQWRDQAIYIP